MNETTMSTAAARSENEILIRRSCDDLADDAKIVVLSLRGLFTQRVTRPVIVRQSDFAVKKIHERRLKDAG